MSNPHGLNPADLLDLDTLEREILLRIVRHGRMRQSDIQRSFIKSSPSQREKEIEQALQSLLERGLLVRTHWIGEPGYKVRWGGRSTHDLDKADLRHRAMLRDLSASMDLPEPDQEYPHRANMGWPLFFILTLAVINSLVLGVLDVVAVSGFIENLNTRNLPWLWVVEMLLGLGFSGFYLQSIDRIGRRTLVNWLLGGLAVLYLFFAVLFMLGVSTIITFPLLYLIYTQQAIVFPMAFWNLAGDVFSLVEARRIFPWLASGEMIGRLIGYALFSLPGLVGLTRLETFLSTSPHLLLIGSAALFMIALILSSRREVADREERAAAPARSLAESFSEAFETVRQVPLFRHLAITSTLEWAALIILWFLFYQALDNQSAQAGSFALGYSLFNIAYLVVPLAMQWRLTGYLLKTVRPSDVPLGLPLATLAGVLLGLFMKNDAGMVLAIFLPMVTYNAWDLPALQAIQNLVPEERRGRVRALLNNYSYALGIILGSILLGGLLLFEKMLSLALFRLLALMLVLIIALGAVTSALWARATYEESLLSWRLNRRQRASDLLDKLEL